MLAAGFTVTDVAAIFTGCQVYDNAPLAVRLAVPPAQIEALLTEILIVGTGATVTATVVLALQPCAFTPRTVYVVLLNGFTTGPLGE